MFGGSVRSIGETRDGSIYLGTWGDGLIKLDNKYNELERYTYDPLKSNSISNNQIRAIKPGPKGQLWIGTNNGLNVFDPGQGTFQQVPSEMSISYPDSLIVEANSMLDSNQAMAVIDKVTDFQDLTKEVQVEDAGTYFIFFSGEGDPTDGPADYGWLENETGDTLWAFTDYAQSFHAGGHAKNRIIIAPVTLQAASYRIRYISDDSHSFGKWNEDEPTKTSLYGIALIKPSSKEQTDYWLSLIEERKDEVTILGNNINDIEINEQFVWVAASGLSQIDLVNNTVKQYVHDPLNLNSLASNLILDIESDSEGMIWLATDAGVDKLNPQTGQFTNYSEEDGLPTNLIQAILEGDQGEMWIATQNGLSHMISNETLGKVTFINYNSSDGLGGNTFLYGAADRSPDGRFYFGGDHGLTTFGEIMTNNTPPSIIISDLLISNKSVLKMGNESPLEQSLQETQSITLAYKQNNLSFEFAALHYANPQKNQYSHILKGYDQDWSYDNRNFATYTNLDPGKYELIVRASNAYGIWNETGKSLEIIIQAPWWKTTWAFVAYVVLFGLLLFFFDRFMRRSIRRREQERMKEKELAQAKEIERAYEELKATQAQLIQSEKMASLGELTAGIAHEIQNPLNFVNNFSDLNKELIAEMKEEIEKENFAEVSLIADDIEKNEQKISHHGKRAESIVKGMLLHSRGGSSAKESTDINALCDEYLRLSFHGFRAKDKSFNADFKLEADDALPKVKVVPQDLGRVLLNLINNAFYIVNERAHNEAGDYKPQVLVSTKLSGQYVEIRVKDNGPGIPEQIRDKIFQPFFTTKPTGQGTGLGLSMSYDIITKGHGGEMKVKTVVGEGTEFIIILPVN
jgi:signal transduction histidine kinase/streptogramin lyase